MRNREAAIELTGRHQLVWRDYTHLDDGPRGLLRVLVLEVEPSL